MFPIDQQLKDRIASLPDMDRIREYILENP
jgi:hypothetical protein